MDLEGLDAREARFKTRDLAQQPAQKDVEIALLKGELSQQIDQTH